MAGEGGREPRRKDRQRIDYDEFGVVTNDTNPGFQPFGFAGGLYDHVTGILRYGARDYDPVVGRWLAQDPERFGAPGANLYVYSMNDPVNLVDPLGSTPLNQALLSQPGFLGSTGHIHASGAGSGSGDKVVPFDPSKRRPKPDYMKPMDKFGGEKVRPLRPKPPAPAPKPPVIPPGPEFMPFVIPIPVMCEAMRQGMLPYDEGLCGPRPPC